MTKKETMTSRERVLKALNHQIPDRVPIDFGGFQTGIHKRAYAELLDFLGIKDEITILDPVQQLAKPCEEILERFRVDIRYVCAHGPDSFKGGIEQNTRNGKLWHDLKDEFGVVWSMPRGAAALHGYFATTLLQMLLLKILLTIHSQRVMTLLVLQD